MVGLPYRAQKFIFSLIGALLMIPLDLVLGGKFSYSFSAQFILPWLFGLTAFWFQILAILASFFKPRLGGAWMLINIALSICIELLVWLRSAELHLTLAGLRAVAPDYLRTAWLYWAAPLALAILLVSPERQKRSAKIVAVAETES